MLFAAATQHVWEDYYITFRSSRNLVQGNGLVFNVGDRVHTFTSPVGVLLPALADWLGGGESDTAALWIFRLMSVTAFGGAVLLAVNIGRRWSLPSWILILIGGWLAFDGKSVDFSINGMETGFLLLFIIYAFWAHLRGSDHWLHQGFAWAGMMWTRPDCCIYVAVMALSVAIFGNGKKRESISTLLIGWGKAGLVTTALYLPWLLWTWSYYGTPIPHTITAKSGLTAPFSVLSLGLTAVKMPFVFWWGENSLAGAFLPPYYQIGGWPSAVIGMGKLLAGLVSLLWIVPKVSSRTRLVSFIFFGFHVYLSYFPYFPFPWYLPAATPFGVLAVASVMADFGLSGSSVAPRRRRILVPAILLIIVANLTLTSLIGRQMAVQQRIIETGTRRLIGTYLKDHAKGDDTVFMEPLGYIGYFSNLRTYDFPGMSSPEMVAARKVVSGNWKLLVAYLRPDWLVLRPAEIERMERAGDWRLSQLYDRVLDVDHSAEVEANPVLGINYLRHDSRFEIYHRIRTEEQQTPEWRARSDFGVQECSIAGFRALFAHAESDVRFPIPANASHVTMKVGFKPDAGKGSLASDGARFYFEVRDGTKIVPLGDLELKPREDDSDETPREFSQELPSHLSLKAELRVVIDSLEHRTQDWTYVGFPEFQTPPEK